MSVLETAAQKAKANRLAIEQNHEKNKARFDFDITPYTSQVPQQVSQLGNLPVQPTSLAPWAPSMAQWTPHSKTTDAQQRPPSRKRKRPVVESSDESDDQADTDYHPTGLPSESESEPGEIAAIMRTYPRRRQSHWSTVSSQIPPNLQVKSEVLAALLWPGPYHTGFERSQAPSPFPGLMVSTPVVGLGSEFPRLDGFDLNVAMVLQGISQQAWAESAAGQDASLEACEREVEQRRKNGEL